MLTPTDYLKVVQAYDKRAKEYTHVLGEIDATSVLDQQRIRRWATKIDGPICDLGCGPGHWTNFMYENKVSVHGVDPSAEFIDLAQSRFPYLDFSHGTIHDLPSHSYEGVLAWYSLIHIPPQNFRSELQALTRILIPGGQILVGFFTSDTLEPFDHLIVQAWFHPIKEMVHQLESVGFVVTDAEKRQDPGARAHGSVEGFLMK